MPIPLQKQPDRWEKAQTCRQCFHLIPFSNPSISWREAEVVEMLFCIALTLNLFFQVT